MRLWSLHPKYLDGQGLLAVWREGLLAQKVLEGRTNGYKNHSQLNRFKQQEEPLRAISAYLFPIYREADRREYDFNQDKICAPPDTRFPKIPVKEGQLEYEFQHLKKKKLRKRAPDNYEELETVEEPRPHPLFYRVPGRIEPWEKTK